VAVVQEVAVVLAVQPRVVMAGQGLTTTFLE
jgi:hypothetical protein